MSTTHRLRFTPRWYLVHTNPAINLLNLHSNILQTSFQIYRLSVILCILLVIFIFHYPVFEIAVSYIVIVILSILLLLFIFHHTVFKIVASYTCLRCHDESADHSADRRTFTKMMCMNCLAIQPIQPTCAIISCNNLSMAKYYCRICKLFDNEESRKVKSKNFFELLCDIPLTLFSYCFRDREEPKKREIYHCPFCNICRVGKGLGIDYFHCMNCNGCMSKSLSTHHICREKRFEDNCPICYGSVFTSNITVRDLSCGHLMHAPCRLLDFCKATVLALLIPAPSVPSHW